ncbi:MAG TPA: pilus assembly protein PilM [Candidatus Paceibacterota bacterium]
MGIFDFGKIPIYSLDISDQSFKFLRLTQNSFGEVVIVDFGEGAIDKGVIENGEIKDKRRLSELLKEVFLKNNIKFIALSLPEEKGFLREIKISGVTEKDLAGTLEFQIEEHIPLPAADIFFEYTVTGKGNDFFELVVNAFPRNIVESYLEVVSSSGVLPTIVESEIESVARSIVPRGFLKTAMIVDWGKTRVSFSIFEKGVLRFVSTALFGGEILDNSISKGLGISKSEAVKVKIKTDIFDHNTSPQTLNVVLPVITNFLEEIQKILGYWLSRSGTNTKVDQIFLSGGDSNLFGLPEYLQKELDIPVSLANPWVNAKFPSKYLPSIKFKDSLRFSSVIGLSLKVMESEKIL